MLNDPELLRQLVNQHHAELIAEARQEALARQLRPEAGWGGRLRSLLMRRVSVSRESAPFPGKIRPETAKT